MSRYFANYKITKRQCKILGCIMRAKTAGKIYYKFSAMPDIVLERVEDRSDRRFKRKKCFWYLSDYPRHLQQHKFATFREAIACIRLLCILEQQAPSQLELFA